MKIFLLFFALYFLEAEPVSAQSGFPQIEVLFKKNGIASESGIKYVYLFSEFPDQGKMDNLKARYLMESNAEQNQVVLNGATAGLPAARTKPLFGEIAPLKNRLSVKDDKLFIELEKIAGGYKGPYLAVMNAEGKIEFLTLIR